MSGFHRVILVSDMHYTTDETEQEMKKKWPEAKPSAAAGDAFGMTQREKIQCVYQDILTDHQKRPLDAVLVLGDLSIDDADFRHLPENYCEKFKRECMDRWPFPSYALPGNHDSHSDEVWREIFGSHRQHTVRTGDAAFLMLDTFRGYPATGASGAAYTGIDAEALRRELANCSEERIFVCAHHIRETEENALAAALFREDRRIVCAFRGHTHLNAVLYPAILCGKPLIDIGGYGYMGEMIDGKYTFSRFDPAWAWGYEVLEWNEKKICLRHIKPARHYRGRNGTFDFPETVEDELTL